MNNSADNTNNLKKIIDKQIRVNMCKKDDADTIKEDQKTEEMNVNFDATGLMKAKDVDDGQILTDNVNNVDSMMENLSDNAKDHNVNFVVNPMGEVFLAQIKKADEMNVDINKKDSVAIADNDSDGKKKQINVWEKKKLRMSYAEMMKEANDDESTRLEYFPPKVLEDGSVRAVITLEDVKLGCIPYAKQLYGFFVGTSMDYKVVYAGVRRLWKDYEPESVAKNGSGFFFFKFMNEQGMNAVLENGPWFIDGVPLVLKKWEPGLCLSKIETDKVPIWIQIHNVPAELWTARSLSKLVCCFGRPLLLDKVTRERCSQGQGRINFARVMIEADASRVLTDEITFEYPAVNGGEDKVIKLAVSYPWKPKQCCFCKTYGHSNAMCKLNPEKKVAEPVKTAMVTQINVADKEDDDGFIMVDKRKDKGKGKMVIDENSRVNQNGQNDNKEKNVSKGYGQGFKVGKNRRGVQVGNSMGYNQNQRNMQNGNKVKENVKASSDDQRKQGSKIYVEKPQSGNKGVNEDGKLMGNVKNVRQEYR